MNFSLIIGIINYLVISTMFLIMLLYGPIDLQVHPKFEEFKNSIIIAFCIFWPLLIVVIIRTIIENLKGGD